MVETIFIIAWRTQTNTVCLRVLPWLCLSINQSLIHKQICWCIDALLTDTIISNCMCRDQGSHVCYSWIWLWGMLIDKANQFQNCPSANKDFKTKLIRHFSSLLDITNIKNCKLQYHSFCFMPLVESTNHLLWNEECWHIVYINICVADSNGWVCDDINKPLNLFSLDSVQNNLYNSCFILTIISLNRDQRSHAEAVCIISAI